MTRTGLLWRAVAIYLATRAVSAVLLLIAAQGQGPNPWTDDVPSYAEFTGLFWDAGWYERVITEGYPVPIPDGQSAWAFFPLYPALVRVGMTMTGAPFIVVAPTISLLAGTAAAAGLAVLVRSQARSRGIADDAAVHRSLAAVLLLGVFPAAPVLQAAYADALALLLVVVALLLLVRRRYLLAIIAVLALGFTRPVALPFAVVVAWHAWRRYRSDDPPSRREWLGLGALGTATVFAGFAWPLMTGVVAGQWDAYLTVQEAWRSGDEVAPVLAWFTFASEHAGGLGVVLVTVAIALGVLAVAAPEAKKLGSDLRSWTAAYLGWLLLAVQPHSSTIRQLILALGIPVVLVGNSRIRLWVIASLSFIGQIAWVMVLWRLGVAAGWPP